MNRQCRTCAMFVPQVYKGQPSHIGRCLHVSFYKSGLAKWQDDKSDMDYRFKEHPERAPADGVAQAHADGFFYHDLIDIKLQNRVCAHWRANAAYAPEVLAQHNDSIDNYPDAPEALVTWIKARAPKDTRDFERLGRLNNFDYQADCAPTTVEDAYEPCATCEHFEPDIDTATGGPVPFRGFCNKARHTGNSVFALVADGKSERARTYTFLSCHDFTPVKRWYKEEPRELPSRLLLFVETNPLNLTLAEITVLCTFPLVARRDSLGEIGLEEMQDIDLTRMLRERHADIDFNQFYTDFHLQPVAEYFAKGLRTESKHHKEFWAPFQHYKTAETDLFADESIARVSALEEISEQNFSAALDTPELVREPVVAAAPAEVVVEVHDGVVADANDFADLADYIEAPPNE